MATGQILHQGLHVTSLIPVAQAAEVDQALYHRRVRSFWAYFSIDRFEPPVSLYSENIC